MPQSWFKNTLLIIKSE
ncbi:hypothetical protein D030_2143A, partial [Vibrio parahaemolyticus AQ3810]